MFKTFTSITVLSNTEFSVPVSAIKAVLFNSATKKAVLVLEPGYVYDLSDGLYYTRIYVEGTVKELTDYINNH